MTLGFSRRWGGYMGEVAGMPTHFPEKILKGLSDHQIIDDLALWDSLEAYWDIIPKEEAVSIEDVKAKLHTMRVDKAKRWRTGMDIHFVVNNRTRNRLQFAPVIKCAAVQEVQIKKYKQREVHTLRHDDGSPLWGYDWDDNYAIVRIDGKPLDSGQIENLAVNDGFDSAESFFDFFRDPVTYMRLIHWTDLRY